MVSISITFRVETPSCHAGQPVMRLQACTTWAALGDLPHFQYLGFAFCLLLPLLPTFALSSRFALCMALAIRLFCISQQ